MISQQKAAREWNCCQPNAPSSSEVFYLSDVTTLGDNMFFNELKNKLVIRVLLIMNDYT